MDATEVDGVVAFAEPGKPPTPIEIRQRQEELLGWPNGLAARSVPLIADKPDTVVLNWSASAS